jgi:hypothetical protein
LPLDAMELDARAPDAPPQDVPSPVAPKSEDAGCSGFLAVPGEPNGLSFWILQRDLDRRHAVSLHVGDDAAQVLRQCGHHLLRCDRRVTEDGDLDQVAEVGIVFVLLHHLVKCIFERPPQANAIVAAAHDVDFELAGGVLLTIIALT